MAGYRTPIGGEFWFSDEIISNNIVHRPDEAIWLDGGISALCLIVKQIKFEKHQVLLVPKYICPSVIESLKKNNVKLAFYSVNQNLGINFEEIYKQLKCYSVKALLFVNYFGFFHSKEAREWLKNLKQQGVILIEDAVQMLFIDKSKHFIGDYIFNSFRKFIPYDGSLVIGMHKIDINGINVLDSSGRQKMTAYDLFMKNAREVKTDYINYHIGRESDYLELFEAAHKMYYNDKQIQAIAEHNKEKIMRLDIDKIKAIVYQNYSCLYNRLIVNLEFDCLFDSNKLFDNIPVVFPILIKNRDRIRSKLRKYGIYCPVHWDIRGVEWIQENSIEYEVADKVMGLPIDWRYNVQDMEYMVQCLIEAVKESE